MKGILEVICVFLFASLLSCSTDDNSIVSDDPSSVRIEDIPTKNLKSSSSKENSSSSVSIFNDVISYGNLVDERDGKSYKTVLIGEQLWMAENLNYGDSASTPELEGHVWCGGGDSLENDCGIYGRLYTWSAGAELCPEGWTLPSMDDFRILAQNFGGLTFAGDPLKSEAEAWSKKGGSNISGFSALPAGYRHHEGEILEIHNKGVFMTNSVGFRDDPMDHERLWADMDVFIVTDVLLNAEFGRLKYSEGTSIRCIKTTDGESKEDSE